MRGCTPSAYLEGVAPVGLSVNHLHNVLAYGLAALVSVTPVVRSTHAILADVEVLGVVDVLVGAGLDAVEDLSELSLAHVSQLPQPYHDVIVVIVVGNTHPGLQVDQDRAGDVSGVVALVVEDVLAVTALGRKVLEVAILADAMFLAELLPELASDCDAGAGVSSLDLGCGWEAIGGMWCEVGEGTNCCCRTARPGWL